MNKNQVILLNLFMFLLLLFSCSEDGLTVKKSELDVRIEKGIEPTVCNLSESDAKSVALCEMGNITRASSSNEIKEVISLTDDKGEAYAYVVNFEKGFILISATTTYYPILGFSDESTFDKSYIHQNGLEIILTQLKGEVQKSKSVKIDGIAKYWSKYVKGDNVDNIRSRSQSDDYWDAYDKWYQEYCMGNCRVRKLINCRNVIPEDVYNRFVALASGEDLWEGTEYSWDKTAYVIEEEIESTLTNGPYVTSQWSQGAPYSESGEPLGCVTIAVGQLMRYHKFPNQFNWYGMYNVGYSRFTQAFLSELRAELNVDDNGGSHISEAKKTLEKYGYKVTQMPHNIQTVHNELNSMRPVFTRGNELNDTKNGHAWIIDGYQVSKHSKKYTLYRLADYHYPDFVYVEAEPNGNWEDYSSVCFYHMNWGWGGVNDAYFWDDNISVDGSILTGKNTRVNLSHDRQDLLIRKP